MANEKVTGEEILLDVKVAEASKLYKFYLNQESKILGTAAVILFLLLWEFMGGALSAYNPTLSASQSHVHERTLPDLQDGGRYVFVGRNLSRLEDQQY